VFIGPAKVSLQVHGFERGAAMRIKKRYLPPGWYPASERQTRIKIEAFLEELGPVAKGQAGSKELQQRVIAGVIPHAGWDFSGKVAVDVIRRVDRNHSTVIVVGGHLSSGDGIYASFEEGFETPLGIARTDLELLEEIGRRVDLIPDTIPDNTVEVQMPFIRYLFPESMVLGFRASPSKAAARFGEAIWEATDAMHRRAVVLGSTDLTHYGNSYGFSPHGYGEKAVRWVKEVNDRRFIDAVVGMQAERAIELALQEKSACSAGAAVTALCFAKSSGTETGRLLTYATSWDIMPSSSFVGYVGILYCC
jgi:AmmeMemoRadiSam system protein B